MIRSDEIRSEVRFRTSRSSGSGGQNVNKVETRVEVMFDIRQSGCLSNDQQSLLLLRLRNRIIGKTVLTVSCEETRSQSQNKRIAVDKLLRLIRTALITRKKRKATAVPKHIARKRSDKKRAHAEKKSRRKYRPGSVF